VISDNKDTTWYIRCCSGGTILASKWEEARQTLLVVSDIGNSEDNFASNEAKWMHHNRKPIPLKYNNSQIKLLLSRPHLVSTWSDHRQEVTFQKHRSMSCVLLSAEVRFACKAVHIIFWNEYSYTSDDQSVVCRPNLWGARQFLKLLN